MLGICLQTPKTWLREHIRTISNHARSLTSLYLSRRSIFDLFGVDDGDDGMNPHPPSKSCWNSNLFDWKSTIVNVLYIKWRDTAHKNTTMALPSLTSLASPRSFRVMMPGMAKVTYFFQQCHSSMKNPVFLSKFYIVSILGGTLPWLKRCSGHIACQLDPSTIESKHPPPSYSLTRASSGRLSKHVGPRGLVDSV